LKTTLRQLTSRTALLLSLTVVLAGLTAQASAAASPKFTIDSPGSGFSSATSREVRASLDVGQGTRVVSARFYYGDLLISTATASPFAVAPGTTIDLSSLPSGRANLKFRVDYTVQNKGGKSFERSIARNVRVVIFRPPAAAQSLPSSDWKPVFNDGFGNPAKSESNWLTQRNDWIKRGIPYSNLEGAGYLPSNANFAKGTLFLSTSTRPAGGLKQSTSSVNTHDKFSFKYGYLESRMLVPACAGCWPAFWLLPRADRWPPEIDIIEYFNTAAQVIPYSAVHYPSPNERKLDYFSQRLRISDNDNYVGTWHTYGVLWSKESVQFYIDGVPGPQYNDESRIPHLAMYPIIQLAVGRGFRPPTGSTMQVDYVRAWQRARS
jgi:beta-glucanase (GH16 family)